MRNFRASAIGVLYRKELVDHIRSRRFLIVLFLVAVTGVASIYSAGLGIHKAVAQDDFYGYLQAVEVLYLLLYRLCLFSAPLWV